MSPFHQTYETDQTDDALIKRTLAGDRQAIDALLRKHQPFIYNVAWKMVQNPNDAADLTQEAMIKVVTHLSKFSFKSTFRTWAYRIVVNHFLNEKRRGGEKQISSFSDMAAGLDSFPDKSLTELERKESKEMIREMNLSCMSGMLLCLNREQRLIYIIGEMFAGDHNIGSEIMGISKDNFRAKLGKARRDLYSFMNNKCGLVNKSNPCRCHKKVTVALEKKVLNAKDLLYNRKEYHQFRQYIAKDAEYMFDVADQKYAELYQNMTFNPSFDKRSFINKILEDANWKSRMNLN